MPSMSNGANEVTRTYASIVDAWEEERKTLGTVQPYTAKKAAEKARALLPWLGKMSLDDISSSDIKRALIELGTNGGRSGDGLSPSTLRAVHLAGSMTFEWAIANDLATINPFRQVPRSKAFRTQAKVLDSDQAAHPTTAMTSTMREKLEEGKGQQASFALAVCIAIATGMRRGEIFALEWGDVDSVRQRISVSKAIKADGKLGSPKSESSVRSVAIGSNLLKLLDEMHRWQSKNAHQKAWPKRNSVLCNDKGGHANMSTFEHWWRAWADTNEWQGLRFHDLRHSHATILIANGVDVKTTQMRLGHSSAEITLSVYAHAIPLADSAAATSLDATLFA